MRRNWSGFWVLSGAGVMSAQTAWADVCDKVAPGWHPDAGAVTGVDELLGFIGSPAGLLLLGLGVIAVLRQWRWPPLAVIVVSLILTQFWAGQLAGFFGGDITASAIAEGCRGTPSLKIAFAIGFALLVFFWSERRRRDQT